MKENETILSTRSSLHFCCSLTLLVFCRNESGFRWPLSWQRILPFSSLTNQRQVTKDKKKTLKVEKRKPENQRSSRLLTLTVASNFPFSAIFFSRLPCWSRCSFWPLFCWKNYRSWLRRCRSSDGVRGESCKVRNGGDLHNSSAFHENFPASYASSASPEKIRGRN